MDLLIVQNMREARRERAERKRKLSLQIEESVHSGQMYSGRHRASMTGHYLSGR